MVYASHFGLRENPFGPSSHPPPPFPSRELVEALNHFAFARDSDEAFFLLVGEVGAGKSTAIDAMLSSLEPEARVALVRHSTLGATEILPEILRRFGLDVRATESKSQLLSRLEQFLASGASETSALLIIDEAHLLPSSSLEELRLLSNLKRGDRPFLQMCLVGQPELLEKLRWHSLRPLRQRIAVRYVVGGLSRGETACYLLHRVREAGAERPGDLFTEGATDAIHEISGGLPREINIVAGQAMLTAYSEGAHRVTAEHVRSTTADYGFEGLHRPQEKRPVELEDDQLDPRQHGGNDQRDTPSGLVLWDEDDANGEAPFSETSSNTPLFEHDERRFRPVRAVTIGAAIIVLLAAVGAIVVTRSELVDRWTAIPSPSLAAESIERSTRPPTTVPSAPEDIFRPERTEPTSSRSGTLDEIPSAPPPPPTTPAVTTAAPPPSPPSRDSRRVAAFTEDLVSASLPAATAADRLELGATLVMSGRLTEAIEVFREAAAIDPTYAKAQYNLGLSLLESGRHVEAIPALRRAVDLEPEDGLAHRALGIALEEAGDVDEATRALQRAVALRPTDTFALRLLCRALRRMGRAEDAARVAARAVALDPNDPELHHELGFSLRESGRLADARVAFEKAVELRPGLAAARYSLGVTLLELGDTEHGQRELDEAMRLGFTPR